MQNLWKKSREKYIFSNYLNFLRAELGRRTAERRSKPGYSRAGRDDNPECPPPLTLPHYSNVRRRGDGSAASIHALPHKTAAKCALQRGGHRPAVLKKFVGLFAF